MKRIGACVLSHCIGKDQLAAVNRNMKRRDMVVFLLLLSSIYSLGAGAATIDFFASGVMNTTRFDPTFSGIENGTPWSIHATTFDLIPDSDPDPNVGTYFVVEGAMTVGDDQFNIASFSSLRNFDIFNSIGTSSNKDRAVLEVFADQGLPVPLSIGPNVIANFFVTITAPNFHLFDDDSLSNLVGLTWNDLCSSPPCPVGSGTRFGLQLIQPGVTGIFELSGDLNVMSITAVPVPSAVWLFGSALGLIGWIRRKAT
jgi:hypothetical protein